MRDRSIATTSAWREYYEGRGEKPDTPNSLGRHERKCTICHHPERKAIEQEFLRWYAPEHIAQDHDVPYASSIYRHAHARGLFERRRRNLRLALEPLIEQANSVPASAGSIIRAIRTYAHINDSGKWIRTAQATGVHPTQARRPRLARPRKSSVPGKQRRKPPAAIPNREDEN